MTPRRRVRYALAALLTLTATAACSAPPSPSADEFLESVVGVEAAGCSLVAAIGSGTILEARQVVTSAHTVAGADDISVIDANGQALSATLVAFDPDKDLAVLSVPGLAEAPLTLGRADGEESGWVIAWNRDEGAHSDPTTVTKRIQVSIEDIYVDEVVERGAIEIAADITPGDSGGAVITSDGDAVGLIYATSRSRAAGFALNDEEIRAVLATAADEPVDSGPCP